MTTMQSAMRALSAKHALFKAFDLLTQNQETEMHTVMTRYVSSRLTPAHPHPAIAAFDAIDSEFHQIHEEVFSGKSSITEQALLLRLTADKLSRCLRLRGSVEDYLTAIIAVGLVVLVPGLAVAAKLVRQRTWGPKMREPDLRGEIQKAHREAELYGDLTQAQHQRGRAKMRAMIAEDGWDDQIAAQRKNNH